MEYDYAEGFLGYDVYTVAADTIEIDFFKAVTGVSKTMDKSEDQNQTDQNQTNQNQNQDDNTQMNTIQNQLQNLNMGSEQELQKAIEMLLKAKHEVNNNHNNSNENNPSNNNNVAENVEDTNILNPSNTNQTQSKSVAVTAG